MLCAIACVSENYGIGLSGKLLFSIPEDMKFFREKTARSAVIMGRKTAESLPGKRPLPGRCNIILSRQKDYALEGFTAVNSVEAALSAAKSAEMPNEDIFIIGGAEIYTLFLPVTEKIYLTEVCKTIESDTFFPEIKKDFTLTDRKVCENSNGLSISFNTYLRRG
ncbi:MAG: dihydrofolate reductase [Ruminococcus sp.]|jgi:dihydrofolate reductase|nr:dihydrofolate reductase [Ruminococcus sp.]